MGSGSSISYPVQDRSLLVLAAVMDGNVNVLLSLLATGLSPNIIINHPERGRITPLILAVAKGDIQCTRVLVVAGANLDTACGRLNTTALQHAAGAGHEQCLQFLLAKVGFVCLLFYCILSWYILSFFSCIIRVLNSFRVFLRTEK